MVGGAFIRVARSVLGADYDLGDCAVVARCGAHRFVAAFRGNGAGFGSRRNCGDLLRAARTGIGRWRVHFRPALRGDEIRPNRLPIWGHCVGDRAVGATDGLRMANRFSSVCGGLYRNCCGVVLDAGVAGTRTETPVDTMNRYARTQGAAWQIDSAETPDFSLGRTFDYPLLARNQSKVGHVQEKAMFHNSNDRVDLGRDTVRVFDKNAGTVEN